MKNVTNTPTEGQVTSLQLANMFEVEELEQRLETVQSSWQLTDCNDTSSGGNGCVQ